MQIWAGTELYKVYIISLSYLINQKYILLKKPYKYFLKYKLPNWQKPVQISNSVS